MYMRASSSSSAALHRPLRSRTGAASVDHALDLIESNLLSSFECYSQPLTLPQLADGNVAEGLCSGITWKVIEWLEQESGLYLVTAAATDLSEGFRARLFPDSAEYFRGRTTVPDLFGYTDRTRESMFETHEALLINHDNVTYLIDYTAAQYGYEALPLVQRFDAGRWLRDW